MDSETVHNLQEELRKKDEQLDMAGKYGNQLLEANVELSDEIEKRNKEHATEIEGLEQEKYSLQLKLEQKAFSERTYGEEVETLKDSLRRQREEYEQRLETVNQTELSALKTQLSSVRSDCERAQLSERQLRERNTELEALLEEAQERVRQKISMLNETTSEEIAALHSDIVSLQNDKVAFMKELGDLKDQTEHLRLQLESTRQLLTSRTEELEQQQCQITSYFNALEKAREENKELRAEIDLLRMESQDQKKKGNSLFSEVEDRRIVAEKQLISMKVQHEAMRRQHEATRQQLTRLKMQLAGLLQMSGREADTEHIERLERQLFQARGEVDALTAKLHKLEQQGVSVVNYESQFRQQSGDDEDQECIDFLKTLVEKKDVALEEREKELKTKSLLLGTESDKLRQCENKLYAAQRQLQASQAQCIKLNVRVEDLTAKYEPDKLQATKKVRKTITERIPMTAPEDKDMDQSEATKQREEEERIAENLQKSTLKRDAAGPVRNESKTKLKSKTHVQTSEKVKTDAADIGEKRPLKTVNKNLQNDDAFESAKPAKRYELKSVKVRKVTLSDEPEVIGESCGKEISQIGDSVFENTLKDKTKKSQTKAVKMSEEPAMECQTQ